jgi:hypothetical protein
MKRSEISTADNDSLIATEQDDSGLGKGLQNLSISDNQC